MIQTAEIAEQMAAVKQRGFQGMDLKAEASETPPIVSTVASALQTMLMVL
ncbi:hypothetical protein [Vitiosangium sp. GDMCC 1.1324]|nr:hypothetical protein [Vitiosangium sp. GDMCC 1.1324]